MKKLSALVASLLAQISGRSRIPSRQERIEAAKEELSELPGSQAEQDAIMDALARGDRSALEDIVRELKEKTDDQ